MQPTEPMTESAPKRPRRQGSAIWSGPVRSGSVWSGLVRGPPGRGPFVLIRSGLVRLLAAFFPLGSHVMEEESAEAAMHVYHRLRSFYRKQLQPIVDDFVPCLYHELWSWLRARDVTLFASQCTAVTLGDCFSGGACVNITRRIHSPPYTPWCARTPTDTHTKRQRARTVRASVQKGPQCHKGARAAASAGPPTSSNASAASARKG